MKNYYLLLLAIIMMVACSVGYGNDSPPKNTTPDFHALSSVSNNVAVNAIQVHTIANFDNVIIYQEAVTQAHAITPKEINLPAPKVLQLNKYIHFNVQPERSLKKVEAHSRSSDILITQNIRC